MKLIQLISTVFFFIILGINLLSYFVGITRVSVAILLLLSITLAFLIHRNVKGRFLPRFHKLWNNPLYTIFVVLFTILMIQALVYPPNNWDSMTYHMSRVVYWIQNQSIEYFPTNNSRQNILSPGAEILILIPQILLKTDRFANLLQTYGWVLVFASNLAIAKTLNPKISRTTLTLIGILSITLPMGLLQATSTQNDLITAGFTCLSIYNLILAVRSPLNRLFWFNLGISVGLTYLIKPTGILVLIPFVTYFGLLHWKDYWRLPRVWINIGMALCLVLVTIGPDAVRKVI